jgi:Nucleotidyl transferase AbiEii toxin, Type IV TA system
MPEFRRAHHRLVASLLERMNAKLLSEARCYFGGGTQLAMTYGEYRESRDVDFLCSSRDGFRRLREQVTQSSLGGIVARRVKLAREVRADRDGIRNAQGRV